MEMETLRHLHTTDAFVGFLYDSFNDRVDGAWDNDSHVWATVFGSKAAANELARNGGTLDEIIIALVLG
jgi:hypothetical protein